MTDRTRDSILRALLREPREKAPKDPLAKFRAEVARLIPRKEPK
jgi:hypothetical protein